MVDRLKTKKSWNSCQQQNLCQQRDLCHNEREGDLFQQRDLWQAHDLCQQRNVALERLLLLRDYQMRFSATAAFFTSRLSTTTVLILGTLKNKLGVWPSVTVWLR